MKHHWLPRFLVSAALCGIKFILNIDPFSLLEDIESNSSSSSFTCTPFEIGPMKMDHFDQTSCAPKRRVFKFEKLFLLMDDSLLAHNEALKLIIMWIERCCTRPVQCWHREAPSDLGLEFFQAKSQIKFTLAELAILVSSILDQGWIIISEATS